MTHSRFSQQVLHFLKYLVVSLISLLIDIATYAFLSNFDFFPLPASATLSYLTGLIVAYFLMVKFVFLSTSKGIWHKGREITLFTISGFIGMATTYLVGNIYLWLVASEPFGVKITSTIVSFIIVFIFRQLVVFRNSAAQ